MTPDARTPSIRRSASARSTWALALAAPLGLALLPACGGADEARPAESATPTKQAPRTAAEGPSGAPIDGARAELDVRTDPRLGPLFGRYERDGYYDVDTSNVLAILEEILLNGQLEPLRRARVELAESGAAGLGVARRILDRYLDDPAGQGWVRNAFDVVSLSNEPAAHELVLRALTSPREELRAIALRMMRHRGTPEAPLPGRGRQSDFDTVLSILPAATATTIKDAALVLHDLDSARAEATYAVWLEAGELPGLATDFAALFAGSTHAPTLEWCRAHWRDGETASRVFLAAAAARAGDSEALDFLRSASTDENVQLRTYAVAAFAAGKLVDELVRVLDRETQCELRQIAVRELTLAPDAPPLRATLHVATADACDDVRFVALTALVERSDERAFERALTALDSANSVELTLTMRAIRATLARDATFARRVLTRLLARHETEAARPASERASLLQSIGQVPREEAATFLLGLARSETTPIQAFEPHRWLCLQAANTGAAGTPIFLAELASETDPTRRIDLLEGLSAPGGETVRAALLELVQGDSLSPLETVYVADRLITLGPTARIAPVLKRVTLRVEHPEARRVLQGLLWRNYPSAQRG